MKKLLKDCKTLFAIMLACLFLPLDAFAAITFKDVDSKFWGYEYINFVSERGLMIGDTSGNFRPNDLIDKFQAAMVLARISGFKYSGMTQTEQQYYDRAYEKNKNLLSQYSNKFSRWNKSSDREVAFLLEKEILTVEDLNQFVVEMENGQERIRALSREEAAMFITKVLGQNQEALSSSFNFKFADDNTMNPQYKPYIYYLHSKGIFIPDENNNFNPKGGVTRAIIATILKRVLTLDEISTDITDDDTPLSNGMVNITSIVGTVDEYYAQVNALQVILNDGTKIIYPLSKELSIYIDGFLKPITDLKKGMGFSAVLNDSSIVSMVVSSAPAKPIGNGANENENTSNNQTNQNNQGMQNTSSQEISGVVTSVSSIYKTISIKAVTKDNNDSVVFKTETLSFANNCAITRNGQTIGIENISVGDNIKGRYNTQLTSVDVAKSNIDFSATLVDKVSDSQLGSVLVVKNDDRYYCFSVASRSRITRQGTSGNISWNNLRIGDTLTLKSSGGIIDEIYATGTASRVEGVVENLFMSNYTSKLTLKDDYNNLNIYNIVPNTIDIYTLRVGSRVVLELDSKEIVRVTVLSGSSDSTTGTVNSVSGSKMTLKDANYNYNLRELTINANTIVVDSKTGNRISINSVREGQRVYVILENAQSSVVKTITIL